MNHLEQIVKNVGPLDGVAQLDDESLVMTDWKSGTLLMWNPTAGVKNWHRGSKARRISVLCPKKMEWLSWFPI